MTTKATTSKTGRKANVGADPTKGSRVKLWQVGLYVFAIGASLILLAVNANILIGGGLSRILLIVALLVTGMSWLLVTSADGTYVEPGGLDIGAAGTESELVDFVASVSAEVGAPMPDAIHLVTEAELAIRERARFFGLKVDSTVLVLGLPYLHGLTRQEFAAVVAHELAHRSELGITEGPRAMRALYAAENLIAQERDGIVNAVYGSYARKVFRSIGGVGVAQEEAAEQAAVDAYGSQALTAALAKHDDIIVANDQLLRDYVVPALQNKVHPVNMFSGFGALLASPTRSEARTSAVARRQGKARGEFEIHRTCVERITTLEANESIPPHIRVTEPDLGAHTLLAADARSSETVVAAWASDLMGSETAPRSWQQLADEIYATEAHTIASAGFDDVDSAEPADRFDQLLTWAASNDLDHVDPRLHALAVGDGGDTPERRRCVWAKNVILEAAAAEPSHRWKHCWEGQPQLVDSSGAVFDPASIAELVIGGEVERARTEFAAATA